MITNDFPLVSVIIPVYNVEGYLDACLDSIKQQTYSNLEILVVEDCSTDRSLQAVQAHLSDERIRLIRHERNGGLSAARNTGIQTASGEYLLFVDSDDVVDLRLVELCVNNATRANADLITYGFAPFADGTSITDLQTTGSDLLKQAHSLGDEYFQLPHFAWLKFIHADLLRSTDIRFPVGLFYEDWPFHWHLGIAAKNKHQLDAKLYHYRQRGTSITGSTGRKLLDLFSVQILVMEIVGAHSNKALQRALKDKLRDGHWNVLTRIDDDLLGLALDKAKRIEKVIEGNGSSADRSSWRRRLTSVVVRLPSPLSLMTLRILRKHYRKP